jgi:uncharacterized protein (DUF2062 family)
VVFNSGAHWSALTLPRLRARGSQAVRRLLAWLWQQEGSPGQRARGLAAGLFMGCFPFFGLQILLSMGLASLVRGNHLLAAAGTWISNPLTYLPLYGFNYQLGCWLLGAGPAWPGLGALQRQELLALGWSFGSRLLLGSALTAAVAAALGGGLCWAWLARQPAPAASAP